MPTQTGSIDLRAAKQAYTKTVAKIQAIYCRTNSSTAPSATAKPTSTVTRTTDIGTTAPSSNGNGWTLMHMARICSSNVAYKYLWTCNQLLAQDGTFLGTTDIVQDVGTTVIDGDTVTTGTISADRLNIADTITAINNNTTTTINGGKITTGTISASDIYIGADVLTDVVSDITDDLGNTYQLNILTTYTSAAVVHTAQLLQNGVDIASQTPNDFEWNAKLTTGYQFIGNGVSVTIPQSSLNYGHAVTVSWTRRQDAYLLNNSGNNLVTNTGNKLIGRTEY